MKNLESGAGRKPLCLVSACLCGVPCRYDGKDVKLEQESSSGPGKIERKTKIRLPDLIALRAAGLVLAVCPEVEGGLPVPRSPIEIRGGHAFNAAGYEFTRQFRAGALKALEMAGATALPDGGRLAILKDKSPSCGSTRIYDGSFSGRLLPGEGITAALLREHGVTVLNETDGLPRLAELLGL